MNRLQIISAGVLLSTVTVAAGAAPKPLHSPGADPLVSVRAATLRMQKQPLASKGSAFTLHNLTPYPMTLMVVDVHRLPDPHQASSPSTTQAPQLPRK